MKTTYTVSIKPRGENERTAQCGVLATLQMARKFARGGQLARIFRRSVGCDGDTQIAVVDYYFRGEKISEKLWYEIARLMD